MTQNNTQRAGQPGDNARVVNGVNLEVLGGTVGAVQAEPQLGICRFRTSNTWVDGAQNRSEIRGFFGAGQEIAHKQGFRLLADEPAILAGNDDGANPVEYLLHALAACLTTSMVAHAAVRGISIDAIESELEGDIDLNGFLGLDPDTAKGFTRIRAEFRIQAADEDMDAIRSLADFSPVLNTLTGGVPVDMTIVG